MRTNHLKLAALMMILFVSGGVAQNSFPDYPTDCDDNEGRLDVLLTQIKEPVDVLVIIARLGDGEHSLETSRGRLHNAKERLLIRSGVTPVTRGQIVTAVGDRRKGFGRLEFYAGGKLVERILIRKNKQLCVDCCGNWEIKPYISTSGVRSTSQRKKLN